MKQRNLYFALALLCAAQCANAQANTDSAATLLGVLQQALAPAIAKVTSHAIGWLGVFASLQFCITNYNLFKSDADIQAHVAKLVGAVAWVGFCLYVIDNGPNFLRAVGDEWMSLVGVDLPGPGSIMATTFGVTAALAAVAVGVGVASNTAGTLLIYVLLFILFVGMYFAFKIFMLQLEVALIAMLSPLSFAFLGLNPLRDQGIAPFKALISLGYRIILLTVLLSGYGQLSTMVSDAMSALSPENITMSGAGQAVNTILMAIGGYILLGYLVFKSDSIAATLASGSTSMGTGDVAQAAAAGAAVGAAIASGGAMAGLGRAPQAMSDFLSRLTGSGSISNASGMGGGGDAPSMPPPPAAAPASMSVTSGGPSPGAAGPSTGGSGAGRAGGAGSPSASNGHAAAGAPAAPDAASTASGSPSKVGVTSGRYGQEPTAGGAGGQASTQAGPGSEAPPSTPEAAPGSGQTAGLAGKGAGGGTEDAINRLVDHLSSQGGPRKPTFGERASEAGRHVGQEQAATHVSISLLNHD